MGLSPSELAQTLLIQFVGSDRSQLKVVAALQVDVARLRKAFAWLLENNWQWMEATKEDLLTLFC